MGGLRSWLLLASAHRLPASHHAKEQRCLLERKVYAQSPARRQSDPGPTRHGISRLGDLGVCGGISGSTAVETLRNCVQGIGRRPERAAAVADAPSLEFGHIRSPRWCRLPACNWRNLWGPSPWARPVDGFRQAVRERLQRLRVAKADRSCRVAIFMHG